MSQERNYALSKDLTFKETKSDFEIQFHWRNKWQQHITLQMKAGCEQWKILLASGNYFINRKLSIY